MRLSPSLLFIFVLALGLRLIYLWEIHDSPITELLLIDSETYDRLARLILSGDYRGEEVYAVNVLYPWFLAGVYWFAKGALFPVLAVQALMDSISVGLVWWLGIRLFSPRAGFIAALAMAVYPPLLFYSGALLTPTLITFLTLVVIALLVWKPSLVNTPRLFIAGLAIGLVTLARGNNLLLLPSAILYLRVILKGWRPTLRPALALSLGTLLVILVVGVRNYIVEGQVVPISANYAAFYIGHNADATGLYMMPEEIQGAGFEDEVWGARDAVAKKLGRPVTLAESANYFFQKGINYAVDNPGEEAKLAAKKFQYFWNRTEAPTNLNFYFAQDFSRLLSIIPIHFGWIAPLGILGMWYSRRRWRELLLLYLTVLTGLGTSLLFFFSAEYRMGAVPVLALFAAFALTEIGRDLKAMMVGPGERPRTASTRTSKRGAGTATPANSPAIPWYRRPATQALVFLPILLFFSNHRDPLLASQSLKRVDYLNFGTLYKVDGNLDRAEAFLLHSLAIDAAYPPAYLALADVYHLRGDEIAAARMARQARQYRPAEEAQAGTPTSVIADSILVAGEFYRSGDYAASLLMFSRLAAHPEAQAQIEIQHSIANNIGLCHYKLGQLDLATLTFQQIVREDPSYIRAHTNLGLVSEAAGRPAQAVEFYRAALNLDSGNPSALRGIARLGITTQSSERD